MHLASCYILPRHSLGERQIHGDRVGNYNGFALCVSCASAIPVGGFQLDRGTSPIRKCPPPLEPPRTLDIGLRYGPRVMRFLVSEVPL